MSREELWARLQADGLVEGDLPERIEEQSPWYVRLMLGIAGWIGALFLLGFVGAAFAFVMQDAGTALFAGAACCAGAFALFRSFRGQSFAEQFALALSLAGQGLMIVGLSQFLKLGDPSLYLAVAAIEAALALAIPNFLHRLLAAAGAAAALALAINQMALHGLAAPLLSAALALVWLDPRRWARNGSVWRPIGYGLLLALLLVEAFRLFGVEQWFGRSEQAAGWMRLHGPLLGRALTAGVLVCVAIVLTVREGHLPASRTTLSAAAGAVLIGLISLTAPGFASALLILLLGFAAGNRMLMALGIVSLFGLVAHFYYSLHATLLEKSGILALTGLFLIVAWLVLRLAPRAAGETAHA